MRSLVEEKEVWIVTTTERYDEEHYDDYDPDDLDAGECIDVTEHLYNTREEAEKALAAFLEEGEDAELLPDPEIREVLVTAPRTAQKPPKGPRL